MDVVVTGIGLRSALGGLAETWKHLLAGQTGIQLHQPFQDLPALPLALLGYYPAHLRSLTHEIVEAALVDADLTVPQVDCGIVIGSSRGNQAEWEGLRTWYRRHSLLNPPGLNHSELPLSSWLETLPQNVAVTAARCVGATAPVLSPMAACATGLWAIAQGYELVRTGQCERVLAGAVETPITPLTIAGFQRMGALAVTGAFPFDRNRNGLVLGEGGAVLVLESLDLAASRGAQIYGHILGVGLTADGYHVSAPEPGSRGAIAAVRQCLQRSQLPAEAIDVIHTHGTATRLNDHNEAYLIQSLFPAGVAISSTKGATGHTIGASGAMGTAICLLTLKHQLLPPCVGLNQPEFELNFVTQPSPQAIAHTLCLSFGFGGQNAAIAFKHYQ